MDGTDFYRALYIILSIEFLGPRVYSFCDNYPNEFVVRLCQENSAQGLKIYLDFNSMGHNTQCSCTMSHLTMSSKKRYLTVFSNMEQDTSIFEIDSDGIQQKFTGQEVYVRVNPLHVNFEISFTTLQNNSVKSCINMIYSRNSAFSLRCHKYVPPTTTPLKESTTAYNQSSTSSYTVLEDHYIIIVIGIVAAVLIAGFCVTVYYAKRYFLTRTEQKRDRLRTQWTVTRENSGIKETDQETIYDDVALTPAYERSITLYMTSTHYSTTDLGRETPATE